MTLFAVQYGFVADPAPQPRNPWSYFLAGLLDTFLPFEEGGGAAVRAAGGAQSSAARGPTPASDPKAAEGVDKDTDAQASAHADSDPSGSGRKGPLAGGAVAAATVAAAERQRQRRRAQLERQPLAAPGASYPAAVARLLLELVVQYLIYDAVLTLVVKPLAVFDAAGGGGPPLLGAASVAASVGFTVVLYLHFTLSYRGILVMLSVVKPELLWRCRHQVGGSGREERGCVWVWVGVWRAFGWVERAGGRRWPSIRGPADGWAQCGSGACGKELRGLGWAGLCAGAGRERCGSGRTTLLHKNGVQDRDWSCSEAGDFNQY